MEKTMTDNQARTIQIPENALVVKSTVRVTSKQPYFRPRLISYGSVRALTESGSGPASEGASGKPHKT